MGIRVSAFCHKETSSLCYVVFDTESNEAAIIDPVLDFDMASGTTSTAFADSVLAFVREQRLKLLWILETHAHADHITAAPYIRENAGGQIAIGSGIEEVQQTFSHFYNEPVSNYRNGNDFDRLLNHGDRFDLGRCQGKVIATPGHTNDSVSYVIGGHAFVGDSLFMPDAGTARCDFPGGCAEKLYESVQQLYQLPDDTLIYVGHDYQPGGRALKYVARVAEHKAANIHLNTAASKSDFVATRTTRDATLAVPNLIIPSIQVNIRAGRFPRTADGKGIYLKMPVNSIHSLGENS